MEMTCFSKTSVDFQWSHGIISQKTELYIWYLISQATDHLICEKEIEFGDRIIVCTFVDICFLDSNSYTDMLLYNSDLVLSNINTLMF
jgi:hypothetical protein